MKKFKSIFIPEEIIIIENQNHQGYVALPDKPDMLQSAKNWAKGFVYGEGNTWAEKTANGYEWEPIEHRFKNGRFTLTLCDSADNSWNGGKLSFWNCIIKAEDGKEFLIGINQELLCKLLKNCTLINGVCQENVWLGREKSNVGVYTESMEDFIQAKEEIIQRQVALKKTKKYKAGDLVGSLTKRYIYLGEFEIKSCIKKSYGENYYDEILKVFPCDPPEKKHLYLELSAYNYKDYYFEARDVKTSFTLLEENYSDMTLDKFKELTLIEKKCAYDLLEISEYYEITTKELVESLQGFEGSTRYSM